MEWHVKQGQELKRDEKITFSYCRQLKKPYSSFSLIFQERLLTSNDEEAPT